MSPKRGAYPREFREAAVQALRDGRDPKELAVELDVPVTTLRVWLHVAEGGSHGLPRGREEIVRETISAYGRLVAVVAGIGDAALRTPLLFRPDAIDRWRVQDAVVHVAHCKAYVVERLIRRRGGTVDDEPLVGFGRQMRDYWAQESWAALAAGDGVMATMDARSRRLYGANHLVYVVWRDRAPEEVLEWNRLVHEHVLATLKNGPESWFDGSGRRWSPANLFLHSDQHLRDIRRALGVPVGPTECVTG